MGEKDGVNCMIEVDVHFRGRPGSLLFSESVRMGRYHESDSLLGGETGNRKHGECGSWCCL